jgi:hypothetical protein
VPMLTSSSSLRTLPSATGGARRWASSAGISSRSSTALTRVLRSRPLCHPSVRPASRVLRACLAMKCPGSGPSVRSSGSRCGPSRRCRRRSPLVCPSRPPVASLPSPSEPARGEPVDRRDFCCCRADREGSESPFTPHGVPPRAWSMARALPPKGRENVESGKPRRDWVGTGSSEARRPPSPKWVKCTAASWGAAGQSTWVSNFTAGAVSRNPRGSRGLPSSSGSGPG